MSDSCYPVDYTVHGILQARILEPFPSPGDFPNPGIEPRSPTLQADSLLSEPPICHDSHANVFVAKREKKSLASLLSVSCFLPFSFNAMYVKIVV